MEPPLTPHCLPQIAAQETKRLRPCPSAPAEANWNPASQNQPCACSIHDAGARVSCSPLPASIPPKSPNLPGNTEAGSLSQASANLRAAKAAVQGTACFPSPFLPSEPLVFLRGWRGGAGLSSWAAPALAHVSFPHKKMIIIIIKKVQRKPCFSLQADKRFFGGWDKGGKESKESRLSSSPHPTRRILACSSLLFSPSCRLCCFSSSPAPSSQQLLCLREAGRL